MRDLGWLDSWFCETEFIAEIISECLPEDFKPEEISPSQLRAMIIVHPFFIGKAETLARRHLGGNWKKCASAVNMVLKEVLERICQKKYCRENISAHLNIPDPAATPLQALAKNDLYNLLEERISTLNVREQYVIRSRFGLNGNSVKTLEAIAGEFNITHERVRQIENRAMEKLSHPAFKRLLRQNML